MSPITVVCGVIVHGDNQLNFVRNHLSSLVEKHIPETHRQNFVFHSTHLFNGVSGAASIFGRGNPDWPLARRLEIADDLAAVFKEFDLRFVLGIAERKYMAESFPGFSHLPEAEAANSMHSAAFLTCSMYVEKWMRQFGDNENCVLVVENHERHRSQLKAIQRDLQNPEKAMRLGFGMPP